MSDKNLLVKELGITPAQADVLLYDWHTKVPQSIRADYDCATWYADHVSSEAKRALFEQASVAGADGDLVRVLDDGTFVRKYRIIGTAEFVYEALRESKYYCGYSSFSTVCGVTCGRVGTENLPPDLEVLRAWSQERYEAVTAWQAARHQEAYEAIVKAFPEAIIGHRSLGQISLVSC